MHNNASATDTWEKDQYAALVFTMSFEVPHFNDGYVSFIPTHFISSKNAAVISQEVTILNADGTSVVVPTSTTSNAYYVRPQQTVTVSYFINLKLKAGTSVRDIQLDSEIAFYNQSTSSLNIDIVFNSARVNFYMPDESAADAIREQEEKEKSETNAQVNAGDSAANSSSSDASASGTTLLAAAQSFVGALTSASPSNCNLDMDLGNLDLGNANLCSISPPPAFQVISSIVLIGFCVPLSIATAKKMVSLFRSFQN